MWRCRPCSAALARDPVPPRDCIMRYHRHQPTVRWPRARATFAAVLCVVSAAVFAQAGQYVGRSACVECHAKEDVAWRGSDHDLAMQVANGQSVLGNFANAKFAYAGVTSTFLRRDG